MAGDTGGKIRKLGDADIYPVISDGFCGRRSLIFVLEKLLVAGAGLIQLRMKNSSREELLRIACEFRKLCSERGAILIVNDFPEIAIECGADGVHLGQDDRFRENLELYRDRLIVGVSTHSFEEAMEAQTLGAGYINIGPIYPTATKTLGMKPLGLGAISQIAPKLNIHHTVMGGIKGRHIPELLSAGAKTIAMVTEITEAEDISSRFKELRGIWLAAKASL